MPLHTPVELFSSDADVVVLVTDEEKNWFNDLEQEGRVTERSFTILRASSQKSHMSGLAYGNLDILKSLAETSWNQSILDNHLTRTVPITIIEFIRNIPNKQESDDPPQWDAPTYTEEPEPEEVKVIKMAHIPEEGMEFQ